MSSPNGLLSQTLCHYLNQGRTLNNILMRVAHWMAYFEFNKLNLLKLMSWKRSNPNCTGNRRDKVAPRTTWNKNVKFKIVKIRTSCQYEGYFFYSENLNWAAQNLRLGRGLDIADLEWMLLLLNTNCGVIKNTLKLVASVAWWFATCNVEFVAAIAESS